MQALRWLKQFLLRIGSRGRKFVLGAGLALVFTAVLCSIMLRGENARAVVTTLRNPMSVFAARSPGVRLGGALYQTKPNMAAAPRQRNRPAGIVPHERVLANVRTRPSPPPVAFADAPPLALLGGPGLIGGMPIDGPPGSGSPAFDVPPFGFGDTPGFTAGPGNPPSNETPGGGGGTGPGTGAGQGPGSAVPEPGTWLMMIAGLGMVGQAFRRQRARLMASSQA
jgi:hypothetical protein